MGFMEDLKQSVKQVADFAEKKNRYGGGNFQTEIPADTNVQKSG